MVKVVELRERQARILETARSYATEAETAVEPRASELNVQHDRAMADFDNLQSQIERAEKLEIAERSLESAIENRRPAMESRVNGADNGEVVTYRQAFHELFKNGGDVDTLAGEYRSVLREQRQQLKGTNTAGGYTAPVELSNVLVESMKDYGRMFDGAFTFDLNTANGNQIQIPTIDDTAKTGAIHTEGADIADDGSQDAVFGQKLLDAYVYDTEFVKFSMELAQDSIFNFEQLLGQLLGQRLGRLANAALTTGTGTNQPNGVLTASSMGVTAALTTAFTADEVIDLIHSVDPAYRANGTFMMSDTILAKIRKLKDGQGNYLWQMGNVQGGIPSSLLGYRVEVNQDMPTASTTGVKQILFGDFKKYFVRKVGTPTIGVMKERFWPNIGVAGLVRFDGELTDTAAIKHLKLA